MKRLLGVGSFVVFPLLILLERLAYFQTKVLFVLYLVSPPERGGLGETMITAGTALGVAALVAPVAMLLGAVIAIWSGPRVVIAMGASLAAVGAFLLVPAVSPGASIALIALGAGLFLPSIHAAAWEALAANVALRPILFIVLGASVQAGQFLGPLFAGYLRKSSFQTVFGVAAAMFVAVAVSAAILAAIARRSDAPATLDGPRPRIAPRVALFAILAPVWIAGTDWIAGKLEASPPDLTSMAAMLAGLFGVPLLLAGVLAAIRAAKIEVPPLVPLGAALVLFACGGLLAITGSGTSMLASFVLAATGEGIVWPFALAIAASGVRPRIAPLVFAVCMVAGKAPAALAAVLPEAVYPGLLAWCALAGLAALVLHRRLGEEPRASMVAVP